MSSFRLPSEVLVSWKDQLAQDRAAAEDTLKDVLRALQSEGPDGHVVVTRHQLFSWAQAVEGAALKGRPRLQALADDMRSYLRVDPGSTPAGAARAATSPPPLVAPVAPAPVVYQRTGAAPAAATGAGGARLVTERELGGFVAEMLREARSEVVIVSPWGLGLDSLANALLTLPQNVVVKALSRRPPEETPDYHKQVLALRKRNADLVFSNSIQTRLVVVDGARLLFGAASQPGPQSREMAIATMDPALVQSARENALRLIDEARKG